MPEALAPRCAASCSSRRAAHFPGPGPVRRQATSFTGALLLAWRNMFQRCSSELLDAVRIRRLLAWLPQLLAVELVRTRDHEAMTIWPRGLGAGFRRQSVRAWVRFSQLPCERGCSKGVTGRDADTNAPTLAVRVTRKALNQASPAGKRKSITQHRGGIHASLNLPG